MASPTHLAVDAARVREVAGVVVREISEIPDLVEASALLDRVWGMSGGANVVPVGVLRAWAFTGNYVAGAFVDGRLVGVSAAFLGDEHPADPAAAARPDHAVAAAPGPAGRMLHSHITGVAAQARGLHVGYSLKLHQRAWAAEHAIASISWTFDPGIRRNARFNLVRLGATATTYLCDFYGRLHDEVNAGQSSDRLLVSWDVDGPAPPSSPRRPGPAAARLLTDESGRPVLTDPPDDATELLVALPQDIESLRRTDAGLAAEWRTALRTALTGVAGSTIVGLAADDSYVVVRGG